MPTVEVQASCMWASALALVWPWAGRFRSRHWPQPWWWLADNYDRWQARSASWLATTSWAQPAPRFVRWWAVTHPNSTRPVWLRLLSSRLPRTPWTPHSVPRSGRWLPERPGAYGFRAINTMDAMVGHRNERFENFGWAAARLDDVANWIPARLFGLAVAAHNPKRWQAILGGVRDDAPSHPSPNAGVAESAMAASLDVELGGPLRYPTPSGTREELRPRLGTGPRPTPSDVDDAVRVVDDLEKAVIALLVTVWAVSRWTSRR